MLMWGFSFGGSPLICSHPSCTGNHNDRQWDTLCPRTVESKLSSGRKRYANQTWVEHHAKQLKSRRVRALKRMNERGLREQV